MKIEPRLMTDAEPADFALTVGRAFAEQSLAGLEMNYDALANAGPAVLGHIAALTADYQRLDSVVDAHGRLLAALTADRDANAERCVELRRQLTEMERERDHWRDEFRSLNGPLYHPSQRKDPTCERVKTYGIRDICDDEFEAMLLELHASEVCYDAMCSRAGCVGDNHVDGCPVMLAWQDHRAATQARRDWT